MNTYKSLSLFLILFLSPTLLFAQNKSDAIEEIVKSVTNFTESNAAEKIYLQTDKPDYAAGDTLWFKAYLFNGAYLTASAKSGIAYIEIANDQNQVVKRLMVSMTVGLGWGNITLDEKQFPQGGYYLRAYTSWMRNFDGHYFFERPFYVSSPGEKDILVNAKMDVTGEAGRQKAHVVLNLNNIDQKPVRLTDFQLKINQGSKTWYRDKVNSLMDGSVDFNFEIPAKADPRKLAITLQNQKKDEETPIYTIPIVFNRPENTDLQFMPEGGYLVAGLDTHVAFKALAEDGSGVFVSGSIFNSKQQEVLSFKAAHLGIGSFSFKPQAGETYTAKIKMADGRYSKAYTLPLVKSSGIVLNVADKFGSDSLDVSIAATADLQAFNAVYYLIGQSRGVGCYGAAIHMNGKATGIKISKALFPTGVARLTLLDTGRLPLNERIVYIDHNDHLRISTASIKSNYGTRDSVGLELTIKDYSGKPVRACFSVAVTDDSQVKNDSLKNSTLKSNILLTADLKGNIEDPGYYFPPVLTAEIWQHLDNLLLAQGWVNYNWGAVFQPSRQLPFTAEREFSIKGKVTNIFNKPVVKSEVILLSKKPSFLRDTVTDAGGQFNFTNISPSDTAIYLIEGKNKRGKDFNVGVEVEEFKAPLFNNPVETLIPWYVNIDSTRIKTINNNYLYKKEQETLSGGHRLKEVKITGQKIIKDSKNLNGDGGSDFALNQEELEKAAKATLGDLLTKNFPGFGMITKMLGGGPPFYFYMLKSDFFHLIIDGIDIDFASPYPFGSYDHYLYVKQYLDYYTTEDIKGVEVMYSAKYTSQYRERFLGPLAPPFLDAFVEVTTRGGSGPFLKKTPGLYVYRPLAFAPKKQFYSPRYMVRNDHGFVDARSTIYWTANVITDKDGKATVSFYTADKPGTYTLLIDGCDMNGNLESIRKKIIVK